MALRRVAALLAFTAVAASQQAISPEEAAALAADDTCQGDEVCSLELRQLRAETKHAEAERHLAAEHEEAKAGARSSSFCCFAGSNPDNFCGSCYDNAMAMDGEVFHGSNICTTSSEGCVNCGGKWCSGAEQVDTAGLAQAMEVTDAKEHAEAKTEQKTEQKTEHKEEVKAKATKTYAGQCTAKDEAIMAKMGSGHGSGSFSKKVADCGHGAYSFWHGFRKSSLSSCLSDDTGLSSSCASCFADAGQYGYNHCKFQCLFGSWCSDSCLSCTKSDQDTVAECAGVELPKATEC